MNIHTIFLYLAILLFLAKLLGSILNKIKIPSVLGEIFVGILLGQSILNIVPMNEVIETLAEIGIILLLFQIGLESDIKQLKKVGFSAFLVACIGATIPLVVGALVSYYWLDISLITSLFIGGALTATSIGITVRVLEDLGQMKERFAQIVLGAAVLDDILGVVVLAGLYEFAKEGAIEVEHLLRLIIYIVTFFILSPFLALFLGNLIHLLARKLKTFDFVPATILSLIFLFAYLAHEVGSPEILGAFTAGLAFSESFSPSFNILYKIKPPEFFKVFKTDFSFLNFFAKFDEIMRKKIEETIMPLVSVLTPIFFISVGLEMNLRAIDFGSFNFWYLTLLILIIAIIGKVASGFFIRGSFKEKILIGFSMLPRGEVGLIFAEIGRRANIYNDLLYAVIIFVVAITTFLAPIILKFLIKKSSSAD
ncbi:cation:proton antiporter [Thermodesulfobacterium hydrogeniphilum]|uniref:cation:proton antiporter n=1 Tax=Thermodesulfobacterium hydrogeniphilum TaxID=161156 RepID=UPI00056F3AE2|nr:cation:proton antiporter [Thermodesulfobacterium hydrogeniphilum]